MRKIRTYILLKGDKCRRAHCVSFAFADKDFGDAKVTDFDNHLVLVKKDILCLKVPVQDEFVVYMVQGEQDLYKKVKDGFFIQQGVTALLYVVSQGSTCVQKTLMKCIYNQYKYRIVLPQITITVTDIRCSLIVR